MIEQTYLDLMNQLRSLPKRITDARAALLEAGKAAKAAERMVDEEKASAIIAAGGYSAHGKNEGEREIAITVTLGKSAAYQTAARNHRHAEYQAKEAQAKYDNLKIEFDAVRTMSDLHREMMRYSAPYKGSELSDL